MGLAKTDVLTLLPSTLGRPGYGKLGMANWVWTGWALSFLIDSEAALTTVRHNLSFSDL